MRYDEGQKAFRKEETLRAMKLLHLYCRIKGVFLKDVAKQMGVNINTISKWTSGHASASAESVAQIVALVNRECPGLDADTEDLVISGVAKYPTVDLNDAELAITQHLMSPANFAENNSKKPSFFTDGVKGVDFAIMAEGRPLIGMMFSSSTVFMVRTHCDIPNGSLVLVFYKEKSEPKADVQCGRIFVNDENFELRIDGKEDCFFSKPVDDAGIVGIYLIEKIQINEKASKR